MYGLRAAYSESEVVEQLLSEHEPHRLGDLGGEHEQEAECVELALTDGGDGGARADGEDGKEPSEEDMKDLMAQMGPAPGDVAIRSRAGGV